MDWLKYTRRAQTRIAELVPEDLNWTYYEEVVLRLVYSYTSASIPTLWDQLGRMSRDRFMTSANLKKTMQQLKQRGLIDDRNKLPKELKAYIKKRYRDFKPEGFVENKGGSGIKPLPITNVRLSFYEELLLRIIHSYRHAYHLSEWVNIGKRNGDRNLSKSKFSATVNSLIDKRYINGKRVITVPMRQYIKKNFRDFRPDSLLRERYGDDAM